MPRLGFPFCTRSTPRLGRFSKGGYAPPLCAEWSKAAAEWLEFDVVSGAVVEDETVHRVGDQDGVTGTGDAVVIDRVD